MKMNGMLGMMTAVNELSGGRYFWMTSVTTPMASATAIAPGRERKRAATTAAKAADMSAAIPAMFSSWVGATKIPANPVKAVATAHTPMAIRLALTPEMVVMASESTMARTRRPMSVKRRTKVPAMRMKSTKP